MGAALNFGRSELGINSPTHRNTHAEEDLFGIADVVASSSASTTAVGGGNDLLEDVFKTCSPTGDPVASNAQVDDDDFFNPRDEESQEFGDFASAFGSTAGAAATALPPQPISVPVGALAKKDEFADFGSAFTSAPNPTISAVGNADILFASAPPLSNPIASNSISSGADLLSDLDGLNLGAPIPSGKCHPLIFRILFAFTSTKSSVTVSIFLDRDT